MQERDPICARCGKLLTGLWYWMKDREGNLTGQAACPGCARRDEQPATTMQRAA